MDHRPISEQFLGTTNINSVSLTHDTKHSASSGSPGFPRPNSEVFGTQHKPSAEAEELEKWFQDLTQYERMLEEMARANLEPTFKEELLAVENWFSALSEAERTAALYSLLHQSTQVQVRFFITVLQKLTKDPVKEILSHNKSGMPTLGNYPLSNRRQPIDRYSMPLGTMDNRGVGDSSLFLSDNNSTRSNRSSLVQDRSDASWANNRSSLGRGGFRHKNLNPIDVLGASNWNKGDMSSAGLERPKSAAWQASKIDPNSSMLSSGSRPKSAALLDPTWGSTIKEVSESAESSNEEYISRNLHKLTLNLPESDSRMGATSPVMSRSPALKSPAFPPGLPHPTSKPGSAEQLPAQPPANGTSASPENAGGDKAEASKDPKPLDPVNFEVLESIPDWMRSLRLHKYTNLFTHMTWRQVIQLNDTQLSEMGVAALGARRKFLKVFEHIKQEAEANGVNVEIQ